MSGAIAKFVGKKILGETMANKFGTEDPYFEQVPATRLDGTPTGKFKKQRKAAPPGLSDHDTKVLTKVKRRAYRLDMCLFNCLGIRFGWSSVIGIVPAIGDVIDALLAIMVVRTCAQIEGGLPQTVKTRMMFNVIVDFAVGLVPFLGDVVDAVFRANTRNAAILEEYLREKGKKTLRQSLGPKEKLPLDPSDPHEFDKLHGESPEFASSQPAPHENMQSASGHETGHGTPAAAAAPKTAAAPESRKSGTGWGSFFRSGSKSKPHDVEMGVSQPSSTAPTASTAPAASNAAGTLKKQQHR